MFHIIYTVLLLLVFFISNLGYWEFIRCKIEINKLFAPSLTICFQISVLFFSGLLNILLISTYSLCAIGIVLFLFYLYKEKVKFLKEYLTFGFVYLFISILIVILAVHGQLFTHYDNFSHWALVVKNMLLNNRYPNFEDIIITFQDYPLGSATFIYYFCKIVSEEESIQMLAQAYMMLAMILPLYIYIKRNKILSTLILCIFTNYIFCFNIQIHDLLVDTLLPLVAAAITMYIFEECEKRDDRIVFLGFSLYLCTLLQIKNSGIFFAAILCVVLIIQTVRKKRNYIISILSVIFPFFTMYLWKKHCKYVFSNSDTAKHAMTITNYGNTFLEKTPEDINTIVTGMKKFVVSGLDFYLLVALLFFVALIVVLFYREGIKQYLVLFVSNTLIYISYCIGMFFMYLYSMPGSEATSLAGADRYRKTIFIALYILILIFLFNILSDMSGNWHKIIVSFSVMILLIVSWKINCNGFGTIFKTGNATERIWFQETMQRFNVPQNESYIICIPEEDSGYTRYLCRYLFLSNNVLVRVIKDKEDLDDIKKYQYLFDRDKNNEILNEWIEQNFSNQKGNDVIVISEEG